MPTNSRKSPVSLQYGDSVPRMQRVSWQITLALMLSASLQACIAGDECDGKPVECDGNVARTCQSGESGSRWLSEACGAKVCVVAADASGSNVAFCALSADPDARCADANVPNCAGDTLVQCTAGLATSTQACAAGCLALDDYPDRCAGEAAPDPQLCGHNEYSCVTKNEFASMVMGPALPPGGGCSEGVLASVQVGYVNYSQHCQGDDLVARKRCSQACLIHADCSTSCQ
jgi:hypothetical protein